MEYLDICLAAFKKGCMTANEGMPATAELLLGFSAVRLTKIGIVSGDTKADWQTMLSELTAEIEVMPKDKKGETVHFTWPVHPAAAWMAARGIGDFTKETVCAADRLTEYGHRNTVGLFDDPSCPEHLSTEILAMTVPVLAWAGKCTKNHIYFDEAVRQMEGYATALYDPAARLWHSEYLPDRISPEDSPTGTGFLPRYGCKGEGYALFALSELVFELPDGHPKKEALLRSREDMLAGLLPYQGTYGMWRPVLNVPGSHPEISGTAWILYAIGRAIKRGTVDRAKYLPVYLRGLAGLGGYLAWDGSIFDISCREGKDPAREELVRNNPNAFAPVILALQQAAQIMHALKLVPEYQKVLKQYSGRKNEECR